MFVAFTGTLGSGKTLSMTFWGRYFGAKLNCPVYANYQTSFASPISDWKQLTQITNGIVLLDELHILMDSRKSVGKFTGGKQTARTHFMLQTRKKNMLVLYTTQLFGQVDLRVRSITDYMIMCQKRGLTIKNTVVEMATMQYGRTLVLNNVNRVFKWYDTYEIVRDI